MSQLGGQMPQPVRMVAELSIQPENRWGSGFVSSD